MRHFMAGISLLILAAPATALAQNPSFAGGWTLNKAESDDARAKLQDASEAGPKTRTGMGSGGRVRVGAGGIDGEKGGGAKQSGIVSLPGLDFGRVMNPAAQIHVEQTDSTLIIKDERTVPLLFYLDGRKVEEPVPESEPRITTAKWKDGKLTVDMKLGATGSIREVFSLDSAKKRLVVDAKISAPQQGVTVEIRRVYDAAN